MKEHVGKQEEDVDALEMIRIRTERAQRESERRLARISEQREREKFKVASTVIEGFEEMVQRLSEKGWEEITEDRECKEI